VLHDTIAIAATVKRSFAYLSDVERVPEWLPNVVEAERVSEIASGPGAETALVVDVAGKRRQGRCRVEESEPPSRLVISSTVDIGVTSTIAFDLAADGKQTRLSAVIEYTLTGGGFGRFLGGLVGDKVARRDMRTALENLKARLEAEPERRTRSRKVAAT
jgi:carbon monoxide dehydrogenase subunit G